MKKPSIITAVMGMPVRKTEKGIEFLLTQRYAPHNPKFHLKWQLAGGGLEFGETPEEGMIRELQEEINVTPKVLYPHPVVAANIWYGGDDDVNHDIQIILIGYLVTIGDQVPKNTDPDDETADIRWYTPEEAEKLDCLPQTLTFTRAFKKMLEDKVVVL